MKRKLILSVLVAASVGSAYAGESGENDGAALAQTKISLTQAIAAAEQHANGRAIRAELEDENGTIVYGVEVLSGAKATDVKVDVRDGKILSAQADTVDRGDGADEREDKGEQAEK